MFLPETILHRQTVVWLLHFQGAVMKSFQRNKFAIDILNKT